jgi:hypothetical protein
MEAERRSEWRGEVVVSISHVRNDIKVKDRKGGRNARKNFLVSNKPPK